MTKVLSYIPYYGACIGLASAFWRHPLFLLLAYCGLSIAMLWRWHQSDDIVFFTVPFALGPMGEIVAIYHGAWHYAQPFLFIPLWLPFAWGCAALYMKKTADAIAERRIARKAPRRAIMTFVVEEEKS